MSKPWRALVLNLATTNLVTYEAPSASATSDNPKKVSRSTAECTTPDGQNTALASKGQAKKDILILENDAINCPLREGDTTFIVSLVGSPTLDRFTVINENTATRGELRIAVSNEKLAADSD